MCTKDRDRTAAVAERVLRGVAVVALVTAGAAYAADGRASASPAGSVAGSPAAAPAAHDSAHAATSTPSVTSSDEPPAGSAPSGAAAPSAGKPAAASPVWHPPLNPTGASVSARPGTAASAASSRPATVAASAPAAGAKASPGSASNARPASAASARPASVPSAGLSARSPAAAKSGARAPVGGVSPAAAQMLSGKPAVAGAPIAGARPGPAATPAAIAAPAPAEKPNFFTWLLQQFQPKKPAPAPAPATEVHAPVTGAPQGTAAANPGGALTAPAGVHPGVPAPSTRPNPTGVALRPGMPMPAQAPPGRAPMPPIAPSSSGLASAPAHLAIPMAANNPALFIGPPMPPVLAHAGTPAAGIAAATPSAGHPAAPGQMVASAAATHQIPVDVKPVAGSSTSPSLSHLDEHLTYQYNALGRRDPFQPLVGGGFVGADVGGAALPDIGGIKVVGIVWGTDDQFAMAEDARGQSMVLRRGDKVMNGVVESLRRDGVVVSLTVDGQSQSVVIPLTKKGEK